MSQCLNPACLTQNVTNAKFCIQCGAKLLLVDRYRASKILGQGGFGRTFKAIDQHKPSQPVCVIKQFLPQGEGAAFLQKAGELFAQEARQLEALGSHDQIPALYAYFSADNRQYLVQEFIEGQTLEQELDSEGVFTEQKIRQLLTNALPVLQFIHSKKVIHRDIKPDNVIRRPSGQLVLVDFGAAKQIINTRLTAVGTVIGSAEFAAPEQSQGKPQYGSDLYSLGVTCLHLLTQISPFDLYDPLEDHWVWRDYLVSNPVSLELGKILEKLIARVFRQRYQSAQEVLADLNPTTTRHQTAPPLPIAAKLPQGTPRPASPQFQNYQETLPGNVRLEMIAIPAGKFLMGSADGEGENNERPHHPVTVPAFYLGKYAITNAQWKAVMGTEPALQLGEKFCDENQPVIYVSWDEAQGFCQKVSLKSGRNYRLPSEAEWEYACRAGSQTTYSFGNDAQQLGQYAWYGGVFRGNFQTQPVGRKQPNKFGLYDMHGNIWEWCLDRWHKNYQGAPLDGSAWTSDGDSRSRLLRGGSWNYNPRFCRSAYRYDTSPNNYDCAFGFRVVCTIP